MKHLFVIIACLISLNATANDFFLAPQPLADNIKQLHHTDRLPPNTDPYDTPLGVTSRCYQSDYFLILSENELGKGYELTRTAPEKAGCVPAGANGRVIIDAAAISLAMDKIKVFELLNTHQQSDNATLLYSNKKTVNNIEYDEQSWVDVVFDKNKLVRFSVFVTLTK